jgi:transposase-like protein
MEQKLSESIQQELVHFENKHFNEGEAEATDCNYNDFNQLIDKQVSESAKADQTATETLLTGQKPQISQEEQLLLQNP